MKFFRENPKITTITALAIFFLVALVNTLYFIFMPIEAQGDPERYIATPIIETDTTAIPPVENTAAISSTTLIILMIVLAIVLLIIIILFALLMHAAGQRRKRDKQRKADLKTIAQALEAYKQVHGQYPLSTTFQPQYYTGINLSNDWNYYGLPNKEHMSKFIPDWPISDPSIDYMAKNQMNQYIYYPKENGQKFFLYAHLESPSKNEMIDYNKEDNLLRSWGSYNYRVASGDEQPLQVNDVHDYSNHAQAGQVSGRPQTGKFVPEAAPNPTPQASETEEPQSQVIQTQPDIQLPSQNYPAISQNQPYVATFTANPQPEPQSAPAQNPELSDNPPATNNPADSNY